MRERRREQLLKYCGLRGPELRDAKAADDEDGARGVQWHQLGRRHGRHAEDGALDTENAAVECAQEQQRPITMACLDRDVDTRCAHTHKVANR